MTISKVLIVTIVFLTSLFVFVGVSIAADAYVNCNSSAIQTALNAASTGDTVYINSGSCTVDLSMVSDVTLDGQGSVTFSSSFMYFANVNGWRITGIDFTGLTSNDIDWSQGGTSSFGVFDNCSFDTVGSGNIEAIKIYGAENAWSLDDDFGTANFVYLEDCEFINHAAYAQPVQANFNGRFVVRYSTISQGKIDVHGRWSNGKPSEYCIWDDISDPGYTSTSHSGRAFEIYGNTFSSTARATEIRGGTGIIFDNVLTNSGGIYGYQIYCGGTAPVNDGNCCGQGDDYPNDYPITDQIGRGKLQVLSPVYFWENYYNTTKRSFTGVGNNNGDYVAANRDFYSDNQSSGITSGTWANRPGSCTNGRGYWATDKGGNWCDDSEANCGGVDANDGALYVCAGGDFTDPDDLYYTPYDYPHPLRDESGELPAKPQNVTISNAVLVPGGE